MARFIAVAVGYDNVTVRQPGDEFDLPDGSSASWFKPAAGDAKGPVKSKKPKAADPAAGEGEGGGEVGDAIA